MAATTTNPSAKLSPWLLLLVIVKLIYTETINSNINHTVDGWKLSFESIKLILAVITLWRMVHGASSGAVLAMLTAGNPYRTPSTTTLAGELNPNYIDANTKYAVISNAFSSIELINSNRNPARDSIVVMADSLRPYGHKRNQSSLATATLTREKSREEGDASHNDMPVRTLPSGQAGPGTDTAETSRFPPGLSIDQSIKAFKIFELLRAGTPESVRQAVQQNASLQGTTILHLAIQCASVAVVEEVLNSGVDIDAPDKDGNSALHLAATLGRTELVKLLIDRKADTTALNYHRQTALDQARNPEIFQLLQLDRAMFMETQIAKVHGLVGHSDYVGLESLLEDSRTQSVLDVNAMELASDPSTLESGGTLLHEAARRKDHKLIQLLLLNGADPFRRDKKGRLPKDVTKDDKTRAILKRSPAATAAQRGVQEKAILGGGQIGEKTMGRDSREIKGYLKKWTNYTSGYKLRWFVLEDGVLSYYKNQDDAGSACRGAMNMKIAKLSMDSQDKTRFEIVGKSSVKYHVKANHEVEAKRWFWALNNAIQYAKDEARQEEQRISKEADAKRQAIQDQRNRETVPSDSKKGFMETRLGDTNLFPTSSVNVPSIASRTSARPSGQPSGSVTGDDLSAAGSYEQSIAAKESLAVKEDVDEEEDYGDDASSHDLRPVPKDAFAITAQSANLQLEILQQVSQALHTQSTTNPGLQVSDSTVQSAISTYLSAVQSLRAMVGDLQRISRDRDAYWQYRLDREADMRRMWEESMAKVVQDQEELEGKIGESEEKRKRTKRALREALEETPQDDESENDQDLPEVTVPRRKSYSIKRRATIATIADLSDSESDLEEEFFDAVGAGEVPVESVIPMSPARAVVTPKAETEKQLEADPFAASFVGYEDPVRKRLTLDADNRPKISLWGILKSMIGKDMTKMTLPVSFNEPTSLLQRLAEDMEYTDLLDTAAERVDPTERMVYVAAFAASEYASIIGRVAKPFNPLLGETFEYARPDKGYRFLVEQVSHHPPIGAAWAESKKWTYFGESAVKSQFYGRSFDIHHLGTWFLRLRPASGGEELYTWKKVTNSVVGIMTGSPTVDIYGPMEIKNWNTGETCLLNFKPRGWKASSAYQVSGKVADADGRTRWSVGGRWNDKLYARLTPGYETDNLDSGPGSDKAFLVWQAHDRPTGIPFNLTPFGVTLNDIPDSLRPHLPQTDTRLRPDQRAMEEGEYDLAATEKNRLEEKQRAKRRVREAEGTIHKPRWFHKKTCTTTGVEYWDTDGSYWKVRSDAKPGGQWIDVDDIF